MKQRPLPTKGLIVAQRHAAGHDHDTAVSDELLFLAAWEEGRIPLLGAFLRVQQIYRANPGLRQKTASDRR